MDRLCATRRLARNEGRAVSLDSVEHERKRSSRCVIALWDSLKLAKTQAVKCMVAIELEG